MTTPAPPDGFADFVASRSAALLRAAWLLTGDNGKAEDLLQTALTATWRRWPHVTEGGNPEGYVRKALYTTYVTWWRRRWRAELPTEVLPERSTGSDIADRQANRDAVRRALAGLSRQQRAIVVLRYVEDRTVAQTAELLECSAETVKVQAFRALAKLRADPHLRLAEAASSSATKG
ncbi:RNA polymerase sigma-70 factor (sigma-E family) [Allocatelliglobosispora scoriae]|uniref:RNA polymerase sigma-70 factor (Sigma-E family) n=1 Tax=Allocatelliglobosispora scoriae TaxID=643052 RepID=A0A841BSL7_9ACTN|nr:SigE family RNA polymerase sigma factor [Allocatelliglobosispora scoriae]MBB5869732.1 RNA polymerase sigma-70 factor (sigma-E family) [Allocatelliglobosispora scoriae]